MQLTTTQTIEIFEVTPPPVICGVYFLFRAGYLTYVGQSRNVHRRLSDHREVREFEDALFVVVDADKLDVVEYSAIARFNPPENSKGADRKSERGKHTKDKVRDYIQGRRPNSDPNQEQKAKKQFLKIMTSIGTLSAEEIEKEWARIERKTMSVLTR